MKNIVQVFSIALLLLTTRALGVNDKDVIRLYLPTDSKSFSMILLDVKQNKPLTKEIYNFIQPFREVNGTKLAKAAKLNKKVGFVNLKGEWVIPATLDLAKNFSIDGIARVQVAKKWGYIRSDGTWLAKPTFEYVDPFYYGFGLVQEKEYGDVYFIDNAAKRLNNKSFSSARSFCSDGTAAVAEQHPIEKYEISNTNVVQTKGKSKREYWGKIDKSGNVILPLTLLRNDERLKCQEKKEKSKREESKTPKLVQKSWHWGLRSKSKKFTPFPQNIISIFSTMNEYYSYAYKDGLFTTITKERALEYFDENATLRYIYRPDNNNRMTLYDVNGTVIYQTNIEAFKVYSGLNRGIEELFVNPSDYNRTKIIAGLEKMLSQKPERYQIPNLIFEPVERDPYEIIDSNSNVKNGRIWILARGYVDETEWGMHEYLSDYEYEQFKKYRTEIAKWITSKYGEPVSAKYGEYIWNIKDKTVRLDTASDTGDGDFYHLLSLEVYKKDK